MLADSAIVTAGQLLRYTIGDNILIMAATAVSWELAEPHLPTGSLPISFATGDAPADIVVTVVGGGLVVAAVWIYGLWRCGRNNDAQTCT